MAKSIWKFPVAVTDEQLVEMPMGAKILSVDVQRETVCLWAEVNPEAAGKHYRTICIFGTGHRMPDDPGSYIGSFMLHDGALVFHAYDAS